jgi:uncharacterized protein
VSDSVLITGASSGIGAELALRFAREGSTLILTGRSSDGLAATADRIENAGSPRPHLIVADLATSAGIESLIGALGGRHVDILVNNAGAGLHGPAVRLDRAAQLALIDLNVKSAVDLALRFLPGMTERRHGGILFVASLAGFAPGGPDMAIYYATKAALLSFSDALSVETAGTGITISALCPGPTATDFGKRAGFSAGSAVDAYGRMSAEDVAAIGHAAFRAGKRRVIPGWRNRLAHLFMKLFPRDVTLQAIGKAQAQRRRS